MRLVVLVAGLLVMPFGESRIGGDSDVLHANDDAVALLHTQAGAVRRSSVTAGGRWENLTLPKCKHDLCKRGCEKCKGKRREQCLRNGDAALAVAASLSDTHIQVGRQFDTRNCADSKKSFAWDKRIGLIEARANPEISQYLDSLTPSASTDADDEDEQERDALSAVAEPTPEERAAALHTETGFRIEQQPVREGDSAERRSVYIPSRPFTPEQFAFVLRHALYGDMAASPQDTPSNCGSVAVMLGSMETPNDRCWTCNHHSCMHTFHKLHREAMAITESVHVTGGWVCHRRDETGKAMCPRTAEKEASFVQLVTTFCEDEDLDGARHLVVDGKEYDNDWTWGYEKSDDACYCYIDSSPEGKCSGSYMTYRYHNREKLPSFRTVARARDCLVLAGLGLEGCLASDGTVADDRV